MSDSTSVSSWWLYPLNCSQGSAEVVYVRRSDALAAFKRYNNVQLDGKPMKIEEIGPNIGLPVTPRVNIVDVINGRGRRTVVMMYAIFLLFLLLLYYILLSFPLQKILQTSIHDVQFIISWHDWCLVLWALCLRLMCSFDKFRPNNYREACICHMWKFIWSIIVLNVLHCCIAKYTLFKNSLKEWFKYIKQLLDLIFSELEHEKM